MDILVKRIVNKPIDSNSFVLYQHGRMTCIVVDPGTRNCDDLFHFFQKINVVPEYIILTHEHFDHIWGVNKLKDTFNCKIVCSKNCSEKIVDKKKNMSVFYNQVGFQTYPADILLENINYKLQWNEIEFEFVETKGHTDGSICIVFGDKIITGDTIIKDNKTITKLPGGSKAKLQVSLDSLFSRFTSGRIKSYPGHGNCFLLNAISIDKII